MFIKNWLLYWLKYFLFVFIIFTALGIFPNFGYEYQRKDLIDIFINGSLANFILLLVLLFDKFYFTDKSDHDLNKNYYHIPKYDFFFYDYVSQVITKIVVRSDDRVNLIDLNISSKKYFEIKVGNQIYHAIPTSKEEKFYKYFLSLNKLATLSHQEIEVTSETDIFVVINKSNTKEYNRTKLNINTSYIFNNVDFNSLISFIIFCSLAVGFVSAITSWLIG